MHVTVNHHILILPCANCVSTQYTAEPQASLVAAG